MEKSYFNQLSSPQLDNPILVEGLPGFGNIGRVVAKLLIQHSKAKIFAEYYSPFFPDYVFVSKEGICSPPHYRFYASPTEEELSAIVLTGRSQPPLDNVVAHYQICEDILDYVSKLGCSFVVTIGGAPISSDKKEVYVAATSEKLAAETMEKGCVIYGKGRIMGATGLLIGLAKERGWSGLCLLGSTAGAQTDKEAGLAVFQMLLKILGKETMKGM